MLSVHFPSRIYEHPASAQFILDIINSPLCLIFIRMIFIIRILGVIYLNIIIDKNCCREIIDNIERRFPGNNIVRTIELKNISNATATHPDMQIHFFSKSCAVCAPECFEYYKKSLQNITVISGEMTPSDTYPSDIAYNAARLGNYVISNTRYIEPVILEYYKRHGFKIIDTRQGYAKCSLCIVSGAAAITEDASIFRSLSELPDINVLQIKPGSVELSGYDHGFIGGASGLIGSTLVFFGSVSGEIRAFLNSLNIEYFQASYGKLKDYGSILCGGD